MIVKILLILACSLSGYSIAYHSYSQWWQWAVGLFLGLLIAIFVIQVEQAIRKVSLRVILGGVVGMIIGLLIAFLFAYGLSFVSNIMEKRQVVPWIYALLTGIMGYLGLVLGSKKVEEVSLFGWGPAKEISDYRILDTSVIIDGRIADLCVTSFIEGTLVVPQFVLKELQLVADSADGLKRQRGRRGLDILDHLQKSKQVSVMITEMDFPDIKDVDSKLIELGKRLDAKIVTNDLNLNKVARLQGISVLNINELANALKPIVLPGESMRVFIIKEGKEKDQGVAYLDDGTMVVIDNSRRMIGQNLDITVTSVLQTTVGKMIFGRYNEEAR